MLGPSQNSKPIRQLQKGSMNHSGPSGTSLCGQAAHTGGRHLTLMAPWLGGASWLAVQTKVHSAFSLIHAMTSLRYHQSCCEELHELQLPCRTIDNRRAGCCVRAVTGIWSWAQQIMASSMQQSHVPACKTAGSFRDEWVPALAGTPAGTGKA